MKTRRAINLLITLGLLLLVVVICLLCTRQVAPTTDAAAQKSAETPNGPASEQEMKTAPAQALDELRIAREEERKAIIRSFNVPISFFGQVVDQDGKPLEGVKVVLNYRSPSVMPVTKPNEDHTYLTLTTDADGKFQVLDARGSNLWIESITKPGYQLSPKAKRGFSYRHDPAYNHHPDVNAPVIYRMWKLLGNEQLSSGDPAVIAPATGEPVGYNFSNFFEGRSVSENPDLIFRFSRPPEAAKWSTSSYDWRLEINVAGGGLIEHKDELPYLAPEHGYQASHVVVMKADDPGWKERYETAFYVRGRDGKLFARVELRVDSKSRQGAMIGMHYAANTNGSRNLEHDPRASRVR
jgi:hypothetical protein